MQNKRIPSSIIIAVGLALSSAWPAWAIGLGNGTTSTVLGRPLEFRVVVRLDAGEALDPACVRAAVAVGEVQLPADGVGTLVTTGPDDTAVVRVRTLARIDEPVVSVQVEAGCSQRVGRRYTVFADPPAVQARVDVAALPEATPSAPTPPPAVDSAPAMPAPVLQAEAAPPVAVASAAPPRKTTPRPRKPRARKAEGPSSPAVVAAPRARLRLDAPAEAPPPEPPALAAGETLALVDQANAAVKAAIAAASAAQQRIDALERSVLQLSQAAGEQRALTDALRQRADAAEGGGRWLWPLALLALALAALAAWLWSRLRALELERQRGWLAAAQLAAPRKAQLRPPEAPSPSQLPVLQDRGVRSVGSLGAGLAPAHEPTPSELSDAMPTQPHAVPPHWDGADLPTQQTLPLVAGTTPGEAELRDVSAEELIDLEQQAEFFVVLGQDDAAIDLLVSHLRDTGGASPLPYLKLLDIYHRLDNREAYERTRDRFNHRFNAHAPAWEATGGIGRTLVDYPAVVRWVQRVWPKPLDAMAELESLLFRKDGGELFDLPAYRELLLLYALARDLLDAESGGGTTVDVLLPLNDAPGFAPTSPRPYFGDEAPPPTDSQPTAPLDLDLGPAEDAPR
jgi:hypothetical protein